MCNCNRLGTEEQVAKFEELLAQNVNNSGNVMEVLQKTQGIFGYIPELSVAKINTIADIITDIKLTIKQNITLLDNI